MEYFYRYETENNEVYIGRDQLGKYKRAKDHLHSALYYAWPQLVTANVFVETRKAKVPYLKINQKPQVMEMAWGKILKKQHKNFLNSLKSDYNNTTDEDFKMIKNSIMKKNTKDRLYRNIFDETLTEPGNSLVSENLVGDFIDHSGLKSYASIPLSTVMKLDCFKITSNLTDKRLKSSEITDEKIPIWTYFSYMNKHGASIPKALTDIPGCIEFLLTWVEFQSGDKTVPKILNGKIGDITSQQIMQTTMYGNTNKKRGVRVAPPKEVLDYFLGSISKNYKSKVDITDVKSDLNKSLTELKETGIDLKRTEITKKGKTIYEITPTIEIKILYRFFEELANSKPWVDTLWNTYSNIKSMFIDVWPSIKFDMKVVEKTKYKRGRWLSVDDMTVHNAKKQIKQLKS